MSFGLSGQVVHRSSSLTLLGLKMFARRHKTKKEIRVGNFVFWSVWSSAAQSMLNHFPVMIVLSNSPSTVKNYLHGDTRKENGKVVGNLIFSSLFKHLKSMYYNLKPNKTRSYIKFYYAQHTAQ